MRRGRAAALTATAVVVFGAMLSGCRIGAEPAASPSSSSRASTGRVIPTESRGRPSPTRTESTPSRVLDAAQARATLGRLTVVPRRPYVEGYQRSCSPGDACSFGPAWTDDNSNPDGHNGCDTRNDVLAEQLSQVTYRGGSRCVVETGHLHDPYTGADLEFTKAHAQLAPVDHVVPLALAWDLGAARWTQQQRVDYANDTRLVLLVVDERSNEAKSDSGPGEWMPSDRGAWCAYDERFVTVLEHYRLPVTAADSDAMDRVLSTC